MYIEQIEFNNWKVYRDAVFTFSAPKPQRNVVLIGALNGGGKTSFLEGLFFCLYGIDALDLVNRRGEELQRGKQGYREFISRALNNAAKQDGDSQSKVRLTVIGDGHRRIVERTWHFDIHGNYAEEELNIFEGDARSAIDDVTPVHIPALVSNHDDYRRNYISLNLLMPALAPFFIFDGEQIQRLAKQEHTEQVKDGLNKLLGLDLLENLIEDLAHISTEKRKSSRNIVTTTDLNNLDEQIAAMEKRCKAIDKTAKANDSDIAALSQSIDEVSNRLIGMYGEKPELSKVVKEQTEVERALDELTENLGRTLLSKTLPLALPNRLRLKLSRLLVEENETRNSVRSQLHVQKQVDTFINEFFTNTPDINNALVEVKDDVAVKLRAAWSVVFSVEQVDPTKLRQFDYMSQDDIRNVTGRLSEVAQLTFQAILDNIGAKERLEQRLHELKRMTKALSEESQAKEFVEKMKVDQEKLTELRQLQKELTQEVELLRPQLTNLRTKRTDAENHIGQTDYDLKCATLADRVAVVSQEFISVMQSHRAEQLGKLMTAKYLELAHKGVVREIRIDSDSKVHLLNSSGANVRDGDLSAGENQVFALSLVGASSIMSRAKVPVVIDTPLARLDTVHRTNIVEKYLPNASEQVIVLSTDTEVVGDLADSIALHINETFLIEFDSTTGVSSVKPGYFSNKVFSK
jgi:DNA sulfur modification protein DndD